MYDNNNSLVKLVLYVWWCAFPKGLRVLDTSTMTLVEAKTTSISSPLWISSTECLTMDRVIQRWEMKKTKIGMMELECTLEVCIAQQEFCFFKHLSDKFVMRKRDVLPSDTYRLRIDFCKV